jgi:uncharacterized protein YciI
MKQWGMCRHDALGCNLQRHDGNAGYQSEEKITRCHVQYVKDHPELLIGGGLKPETTENFCGALWVVEAEGKQEVGKLVLDDPFYFPEFREFEVFLWGKILEGKTVIL